MTKCSRWVLLKSDCGHTSQESIWLLTNKEVTTLIRVKVTLLTSVGPWRWILKSRIGRPGNVIVEQWERTEGTRSWTYLGMISYIIWTCLSLQTWKQRPYLTNTAEQAKDNGCCCLKRQNHLRKNCTEKLSCSWGTMTEKEWRYNTFATRYRCIVSALSVVVYKHLKTWCQINPTWWPFKQFF